MSNSANITPVGKIRVYAAGGCGMNIGLLLEKYRNTNVARESGFGELDIVYIDTSKSNLRNAIKDEHCYILEGMDGSGKVRSENHETINERIRAIMQEFKPADLNIIISSAGGGSGSVIAPLLTSELLANQIPTVVITVGSADTILDAENTLKTIKSYESIARLRKAPVIMSYIQNAEHRKQAQSNEIAVSTVMALCILFSRQNHGLDSRDLANWLRYDRVTSFPVQLAALTLVDGTDKITDVGNVISVATLARHGDTTALASIPDYQCVGYLPEDCTESVVVKAPIHFITSDGIFSDVAAHLNGILRNAESVKNARIKNKGVITNTDSPIDNGLVL
jgi:hypothetical protein